MAVGQTFASKYVHPLTMASSAYTNTEAAHFTFTNLNEASGFMCVRGVVTSKRTGKDTSTIPVCTGELKPHTTILLEAPFPVGSVMDLCGDEPDRFGIQHVNWSNCTFEATDINDKSSR